jgi:glycosyltransferase involved in cell wall biosynthesis
MKILNYSVLMCVYAGDNCEDVKNAIRDIQDQTIPFEEFIIIVDGPIPFELNQLLVNIKASRIRVIWLDKNFGLGEALNRGTLEVKSEFILRMDADDRCPKLRVEELLRQLESKNGTKFGALGSNIVEFLSVPEKPQKRITYREQTNLATGRKFDYFRDPVGHASLLIKKEALITSGGYKHCLYFEDTYLLLRMLKLGYILYSVPEDLYFARISKSFFKRRSGLKYLRHELSALTRFYSEGLISYKSYIINILLRPTIRLMPLTFLKLIYNIFLRV